MKNLIHLPLSYDYSALEPVISRQIMELHHGKHYLGYVNGANAAIDKLAKQARKEIDLDPKALTRDLSFHYNGAILHEIFWQNMRPPMQDNQAGGILARSLDEHFGSFTNFQSQFGQIAAAVEGSGWVILWKDTDKNLYLSHLEKHNLLGLNGLTPLLALDVWEHAYYLDYLNDRQKYIQNWWQVVNWDDVQARFEK